MNNNIDKNQAIGLVLISALLIVYFTFFSDSSTKQVKPESEKSTKTISPQNTASLTEIKLDSASLNQKFGDLSTLAEGIEQDYTVENEFLKLVFSNKGGKIKSVLLKNYKTYAKQDMYLLKSEFNNLSLLAQTSNGKTNLSELFYQVEQKNEANNQIITFKAQLSENKYIKQVYILPKESYELKYDVSIKNLSDVIKNETLTFNWVQQSPNTEKDLAASRQAANITYRSMDGTYSSLSETKLELQEATPVGKINWVDFKQKFFSTGFIAENGFTSGNVKSDVNVNDSSVVKTFTADLNVSLADLATEKGKFKFYFGPNKLSLVAGVAPNFNENVYLGWPVINNINRYTMAPLFTFLEKFISNYGVIIICMVLIIKAVLFPLSFQAYKSMAKIKVLKPEIDEIKARTGDDMTAMQQEQMKLYQQVGVNPISGCIPVLLQMPVLLAMFNFFPNAIELRQQPFLWAEDLSTFDSIATLPFSIPFYGDHVSMFALLMTASTILYTWYNNQINVSATGPMIAMSYLMPLVFMFVLNSMPAGLSFYYFVSNMITIGQQSLIKLFVDEKAIRAKLEDNKKNADTRKPNRFQQRLMSAMEEQQKLKAKPSKK
jgi:YidC/Oxa1 family membrane protein insertase